MPDTPAATPPAATPTPPAATPPTPTPPKPIPTVPTPPAGPAARLRARFEADAANKKTAAPAAAPPKPGETATPPKPGETPAAPGEGEGDTPPAETPVVLGPEDEAYVQQVLSEIDAQDALQREVGLWSTTFHDSTRQWLETQRAQREQRLQAQLDATRAATASPATTGILPAGASATPGATDPATIAQQQFQTLNIQRPIRSVRDLDSPFEGKFITAENVQDMLGVDPKKIPSQWAAPIEKLINQHNRLLSDASFYRGEGQQAFRKRDAAQSALFNREAEYELEKAGIKVEGGLELILPELKKIAHKEGNRRPWASVIDDARKKWPNLIGLKPAAGTGGAPAVQTSAAATPAATPAAAPAAPASPQGTRVTTSAPPASPAEAPPKTFGEARRRLAARGKQM